MSITKSVLSLILVSFAIFVIWMNATPGHFQSPCGCGASYLTQREADSMEKECASMGICMPSVTSTFYNLFLYFASKLDFNR